MAEVWFDFGEPASPDLIDPGEDYTLALGFAAGEDCPCLGVRWRVPDTAPTGTCSAAVWRVSDEQLLAFKDFTITTEQGAELNIYFDQVDVPTLSASVGYRASIYTPNRYVATTSYGWPVTEGILTAGSANGWLATAPQFPAIQSGNSANYHVSPIIEGATVDGVLAVALPAAAGSLAATLTVRGALAAILPAVGVSLRQSAGTVIRPASGTVSRPDAGTVTRPNTGIVSRP
ncbi:hypothetical protein ACFHW1_04965 [Micromonospora sp. LOL_014]|uniref:hypothetical protein n=1 Tax=Micromonospora sp. LOL_014 TaxID=3345415 RepID=UPI003A887447